MRPRMHRLAFMALPTDNLLALFRSIVDIESVSHHERELAESGSKL